MPFEPRVMVFVDGTNLLNGLARAAIPTSRFKDPYVAKGKLDAHRPLEDALRLAQTIVTRAAHGLFGGHARVLRTHWYGSSEGSAREHASYVEGVKEVFKPTTAVILKKRAGAAEKGVDLALAVDALNHARDRNIEAALLVAGDADYQRLGAEIKRCGVLFHVAYFGSTTTVDTGLSDDLRLEADRFHDLAGYMSNEPRLCEALVEACESSRAKAENEGSKAAAEAMKRIAVEGPTEENLETLRATVHAATGNRIAATFTPRGAPSA